MNGRNSVTYYWASIEYGRERYVQVVKTKKGEIEAEAAAWDWGRRNLAPAVVNSAIVRYLGRSEPRVQY
ncbi:hypothetical protein [Streptomyces buecherae]|uniref:Uncharacterized protein n=1 Tax=Streptomyces buecherae TaxID=2763006 RepID=A0A7H8N3B8_9ACTN|nr:hypothetical protein [Streptomyces buecherae]QKW48886.1 hypothetical protein HUT08_04260 [Streptomyces buecherae]